jgi:hypothetical protein
MTQLVRKMIWLVPRMAKAVPYLGYILVAGTKVGGAEDVLDGNSTGGKQ